MRRFRPRSSGGPGQGKVPGPHLARFAAALLAVLAAAFAPSHAAAGDEPFTGPSNHGITGLLEIPTARVMTENRFRFGATQVRPYRIFYGTVGLFERLEVNGRLTQVLDVPAFTTGYGDYRDKAFDLKLQLLKEGKYLPAFSLVVSDPNGTRVYASQSLVASKQLYPFDFTLGMGNGRYGKEPLPAQGEGFQVELFSDPSGWWKDARLFGGIQFAPTKWLSLMAEYSPIRYDLQTTDPAQPKYFPKPVPSKINAGLRLKPFRWAEIGVSWQRGQEIGVSASISTDIGKPFLPIYDPPYLEPDELRRDPLAARIAAGLHAVGFSDIGVSGDGLTLQVDAENNRYFFTPTAVEVIAKTIAPMVPPEYVYVRIRIKENGIPVAQFATVANALDGMREGSVPRSRIFDPSSFRAENLDPPIPDTSFRRWFDYGIGPSFEAFLNDPSRFFSYRLGIEAFLNLFPWKGGMAAIGAEAYPLNNVTTANQPLSIPVRSDIALYKEQNVALGRLLFDQIVKIGPPLFARAAAGLLEVEYGGVDGEVALPLWRGRVVAGAGGSYVRKRDPDDPFGFVGDTWYKTGFVNGRLNVPEADVWLDVKAGRFLAGDKGVRFSASKFINGVTLSAWYTMTDTSIFSDPYNSGYHDKGVSVTIPIRLFLGHDSRTTYQISLSPWTRDVGQDVDHYRTLTDFIGRNLDILLDRDAGNLFK